MCATTALRAFSQGATLSLAPEVGSLQHVDRILGLNLGCHAWQHTFTHSVIALAQLCLTPASFPLLDSFDHGLALLINMC